MCRCFVTGGGTRTPQKTKSLNVARSLQCVTAKAAEVELTAAGGATTRFWGGVGLSGGLHGGIGKKGWGDVEENWVLKMAELCRKAPSLETHGNLYSKVAWSRDQRRARPSCSEHGSLQSSFFVRSGWG